MQLTGSISRSVKVRHHIEKTVRDLAGKRVLILPETIRKIPKYGIFVDVMPMDLQNEKPESISIRFIKMNNRTKKVLCRAS